MRQQSRGRDCKYVVFSGENISFELSSDVL